MGVPERSTTRHASGFETAQFLTRKRVDRMLTYMRAGIAAVGIETTDPLAPDWQERAEGELEAVRVVLVKLQELIRDADPSGLR